MQPRALVLLVGALLGCQAPPASAPVTPLAAVATEGTPIAAESPTALPSRTPPHLPGLFTSRYLRAPDEPHTYAADACTYLRNRWDAEKSQPGTIVMIIMLHSINRGKGEGPEATTPLLFSRMMDDLHDQNFEAINLRDLAGFLESNARIPMRSVVLVQDQSRLPRNFDAHFRDYWDAWGWPVVNAWDPRGTVSEALWAQYAALSQEGMVDFQVYGPTFRPGDTPYSDEVLAGHLQKPMEVLEERLGAAPIGVVWPNGFSSQSIRVSRDLGYRLGFTFNSRGPVMYNWVPLADSPDKLRPSYQAEGPLGDPLMTLPRYWPNQVHGALDAVRITGEEAAAAAEKSRAIELEYYEIVCAPDHGPINRE